MAKKCDCLKVSSNTCCLNRLKLKAPTVNFLNLKQSQCYHLGRCSSFTPMDPKPLLNLQVWLGRQERQTPTHNKFVSSSLTHEEESKEVNKKTPSLSCEQRTAPLVCLRDRDVLPVWKHSYENYSTLITYYYAVILQNARTVECTGTVGSTKPEQLHATGTRILPSTHRGSYSFQLRYKVQFMLLVSRLVSLNVFLPFPPHSRVQHLKHLAGVVSIHLSFLISC